MGKASRFGPSKSISQAEYYPSSAVPIDDLDNLLAGIRTFGPETANTAVAGNYGVCVAFANVDPYRVSTGRWVTQVYLPTTGYPKWRRKVNQGAWSDWLPFVAS